MCKLIVDKKQTWTRTVRHLLNHPKTLTDRLGKHSIQKTSQGSRKNYIVKKIDILKLQYFASYNYIDNKK